MIFINVNDELPFFYLNSFHSPLSLFEAELLVVLAEGKNSQKMNVHAQYAYPISSLSPCKFYKEKLHP